LGAIIFLRHQASKGFSGGHFASTVAPLNGITMGDGAAISIPGTFHVATEKTVQSFNFSVGLRYIIDLWLLYDSLFLTECLLFRLDGGFLCTCENF
ncbi:hypothetical protein H5410_019075, partial [Solanum commersonii]